MKSNKRVWHSGQPPHVGWWNASDSRVNDAWRWWDGINWSKVAFSNQSCCIAKLFAEWEEEPNVLIEWSDYWPENARVPRIDPGKVKS